MDRFRFLADVKTYIAHRGFPDGLQPCDVRNMGFLQTRHATKMTCAVLDPVISLVLQGKKFAQYGTRKVTYAAGDVVIVGQSLPTMSSITKATPDSPFIAIYVALDMQIMRSIYSDMGMSTGNEATVTGLETGAAEAELVDALARMFRLHRDPDEERALGDAALREVYFRVLRSQHSRAVQQMIHLDSKANQVAKAIAHIRKEYRRTLKASDLASIAGMSPSVFYETFKQVTASSPLQYQKDLRLLEAHQMLQHARKSVSEIALAVGYESASQFSREFSRKFGASPKTFSGTVPA